MIVDPTLRERVVTEAMLDRLPPPVQRYLRYTGVPGKPWTETVRLRYSGRFRMAPSKPWMGLAVEQIYTTRPPSFHWKARFSMAGLPFMFADDVYTGGHGHMLGKLFGLFTIVDGQGEQVDQGTMVRYLQEMSWFPIAYLGDNVTWSAVDDHCADVTLTDFGKSVSARVYFDDLGRMINFAAQRYGDFWGETRVETWTTPMVEYGSLAGLNLPLCGKGVWLLPGGDFAYIDVHVRDIVYNVPIAPF